MSTRRHAFTDLSTAAYCPRKLYYRRRDGVDAPERDARHELAFRYEALLPAGSDLGGEPIAVSPTRWRSNLGRDRARLPAGTFEALCDPAARDVLLEGRQATGVAHKVVETPLAPSMVFAGDPPALGVWEPHVVRAVAAAKALSWERETRVRHAFVEYPTHGVIRTLELTARRVGAYRRAVRTAATIDGPPPRTSNREKCRACDYRGECGVRTRSLRSLLG